jgi:SAM-dependent methyltransferase
VKEPSAADRRPRAEASVWEPFSVGYEQRVISLTSLESTRRLLVREAQPGLVVDLGCGPVGLLHRDLASVAGVRVVACDFSLAMIRESRARFRAPNVEHLVADNRDVPLEPGCADAVYSVNSILPEHRPDADRMFSEVARILRPQGRFVAVLPSFEMSIVSRDDWGMPVELDLDGHREWDTSGWQCFYTEGDIAGLIERHGFRRHRLSRIVLGAPEEIAHVRTVYAQQLEHVAPQKLEEYPLFEHLLIAEK